MKHKTFARAIAALGFGPPRLANVNRVVLYNEVDFVASAPWADIRWTIGREDIVLRATADTPWGASSPHYFHEAVTTAYVLDRLFAGPCVAEFNPPACGLTKLSIRASHILHRGHCVVSYQIRYWVMGRPHCANTWWSSGDLLTPFYSWITGVYRGCDDPRILVDAWADAGLFSHEF